MPLCGFNQIFIPQKLNIRKHIVLPFSAHMFLHGYTNQHETSRRYIYSDRHNITDFPFSKLRNLIHTTESVFRFITQLLKNGCQYQTLGLETQYTPQVANHLSSL